ncbi:MAG: divalent metal cation transporter [Gammaproteobacteria bacterium]|nr:divalent metal cation transporter [Gammaproteobacteria bacterium]MCP5200253.1 divalent metal cation transporter [Gammaproteobacteria bacterium]
MTDTSTRPWWAAFGPGLVFAGAAVGVSHLVQSTRAGASFGLAALVVVVLACAVKFPAFRFGPLYAGATGHSLLAAYRRQGRWTLVIFALLTLCTMFTVTAAVTLVTAGIAIPVLGLGPWLAATVGAAHGPLAVSAVLLAGAAILLALGGYPWLDRFIKFVMPVLSVATLAATLLALRHIEWSWAALLPDRTLFTAPGVAFTVALIGWMPSAIDISVWSSLWTVARARQGDGIVHTRGALLDFDAGYAVTLLLALAFVVLGTAVMHGRGIGFENSPPAFATQVIDLYASMLGDWSRPVIGACALLVMISTVVTVVDGFPRVIAALLAQWQAELHGAAAAGEGDRRVYRAAFAVVALGALAILAFGMQSFKGLVDLATTISFLTAPVLAWFNHRAVHGDDVAPALRPGVVLRRWSLAAIAVQAAFAAWFVWTFFVAG